MTTYHPRNRYNYTGQYQYYYLYLHLYKLGTGLQRSLVLTTTLQASLNLSSERSFLTWSKAKPTVPKISTKRVINTPRLRHQEAEFFRRKLNFLNYIFT